VTCLSESLERYNSLLERAKAEITPVEFLGGVGDVLFAHALLVHSGGINEGSDVRLAVINDFQRVRPKTTLMWQVEDAHTPHTSGAQVVHPDGTVPFPPGVDLATAGEKRCKLIWHHDSVEFAEPQPTRADMWAGWAFSEQPSGSIVNDPLGPWWCGGKRCLGCVFLIQNDYLPRQAWDKPTGKLKGKDVFPGRNTARCVSTARKLRSCGWIRLQHWTREQVCGDWMRPWAAMISMLSHTLQGSAASGRWRWMPQRGE
jgi:hypothetical protein